MIFPNLFDRIVSWLTDIKQVYNNYINKISSHFVFELSTLFLYLLKTIIMLYYNVPPTRKTFIFIFLSDHGIINRNKSNEGVDSNH